MLLEIVSAIVIAVGILWWRKNHVSSPVDRATYVSSPVDLATYVSSPVDLAKYVSSPVDLATYVSSPVDLAIYEHRRGNTLLWIAKTNEYFVSDDYNHAEINFMENSKTKYIDRIYIKNSPCYDCSQALCDYYERKRRKPTIYVGRIWYLDDIIDDEGLRHLMRRNFKLKVWEELHERMYPSGDTTTHNYLRRLR